MSFPQKRLLLIGPLPPPLGGVSMHLQRLSKLLKNDFEIDLIDESKNIKKDIYNLRKLNLVNYIRKIRKSDLVSIHSGTRSLRFFHIIVSKLLNKKVVLTIHAYPNKKNDLVRRIDQFVFGLSDLIILVNKDFLKRVHLPPAKTIVKFAFLPPVMENELELPSSILQWIAETKKIGRKIICSNAWRLDRFNNQDLYGVDMCIEVAKRLKKKGVPVRFLFNIATIDKYGADYKNYQEQIKKEELEDCFSLTNESLSFVRLIKEADVVVRPTNTDGDSLSIREAIYLRKPIISSDAIERPFKTIIFKNRDIDDFEYKILEVLKHTSNGTISPLSGEDYSYHLFYKKHFLNLFQLSGSNEN